MDFREFVLAATTGDLGEEPAARAHADAVEFRMDLADAPLDALRAYEGELPLIATNRAPWEGGGTGSQPTSTAAERDRLDALVRAAGLPHVEAVDVELRALDPDSPASCPPVAAPERAEQVVEAAASAGTSVIASVHDFEGTPDPPKLRRLLEAATETGDVGKLAVTAHGPGDVLDLLAATHDLASDGHLVATMAMGEAGQHSRAVAPLYGSCIGYAPVDPSAATAPGQFDLGTLADLLATLGTRAVHPESEG